MVADLIIKDIYMNINTKEGTKIIFLGRNGRDMHLEIAKKILTPRKTYTVKETNVYGWYTDVVLKEFPGRKFNSVMFEEEETYFNELEKLQEGCGNKVDRNGDCAYYSSQGNLRICSTCWKKIKNLKQSYGKL